MKSDTKTDIRLLIIVFIVVLWFAFILVFCFEVVAPQVMKEAQTIETSEGPIPAP